MRSGKDYIDAWKFLLFWAVGVVYLLSQRVWKWIIKNRKGVW